MDISEWLGDLQLKRYNYCGEFVSKKDVKNLVETLIQLLFPQTAGVSQKSLSDLEQELKDCQNHVEKVIGKVSSSQSLASEATKNFFESLPIIEKQLTLDATFIYEEDPAAKSFEEVLFCYPGFFAIATYRLAHNLYTQNVALLPRMMTSYSQEKTGVDIHPGAHIGSPFSIDHGTGVVIGETTHVGDSVKLFQGVTLGALDVKKDGQFKKRHPTIKNNCVIYANATILGGETEIGEKTIIGGNVWLTKSIPSLSRVYNKSEFTLKK